MKHVLYALLLAVVLPFQALAQEVVQTETEAPFGLKWGLSETEARNMGLTLSPVETDSEDKAYAASNLPKVLSDTEILFLSFGYDDKLWRIATVSKKFENDPYGTQVKARYSELNEILKAKYGNGVQRHHTDTRLYTEPDDFLSGLKSGRSFHGTTYSTPEIKITLTIGAESHRTGYYLLQYVHKALHKEYEESGKKREESAL